MASPVGQAWKWARVNSRPLRALEGRVRDLAVVLILRRGPREGPKRGAGVACGASWGCLKDWWRDRDARCCPPEQMRVSARAPQNPRCGPHAPPVAPVSPRPSPRRPPTSTAPGSNRFFFLLKTKQKSRIQGGLPSQAQGGLPLVSQLSPFLKCCYIKRLQQKNRQSKTQEGMQNGTGSRSRRRKQITYSINKLK